MMKIKWGVIVLMITMFMVVFNLGIGAMMMMRDEVMDEQQSKCRPYQSFVQHQFHYRIKIQNGMLQLIADRMPGLLGQSGSLK